MKQKAYIKIMLIAAISMAITSCADNTPTVGSQSGVISDAAASDISNSTESTDPETSEPTSILDDKLTVDTKPIYLAWWDANARNGAEVQKFKELYGVPEKIPEGYEDTPEDALFAMVNCSYEDRYNTLISLLQSGDSPDIFELSYSDYPYGAYSGYFGKIGELFNFNDTEWDATRDGIEQLKWGTEYYIPVTDITPVSWLWYRRSVIEEAGLEDPWTLYTEGKWTLDKFIEICRDFTDTEKSKYGVDGWYFSEELIGSTGVPMIGLNDGQLVNNLYDPDIENIMEVIRLFDDEQEGLRYPREILNGWDPDIRGWGNKGNILFFNDGLYAFEGQTSVGGFYRLYSDWAEDEVQFVPYPKYKEDGEYYCRVRTEGCAMPSGAKNIDGYKAWVYANLLTADNKLERYQKDNDVPDYIIEHMRQVMRQDSYTAVYDMKDVLDDEFKLLSSCGDTLTQMLIFYPTMNNVSYTSIRDEYAERIDKIIENLNAMALNASKEDPQHFELSGIFADIYSGDESVSAYKQYDALDKEKISISFTFYPNAPYTSKGTVKIGDRKFDIVLAERSRRYLIVKYVSADEKTNEWITIELYSNPDHASIYCHLEDDDYMRHYIGPADTEADFKTVFGYTHNVTDD
ncbi:MAG: extracellular solute-binding protein [Eubacterium sp.]|nr:extracellular solute-binding protein [Eubacterium sp.]